MVKLHSSNRPFFSESLSMKCNACLTCFWDKNRLCFFLDSCFSDNKKQVLSFQELYVEI